MRKTTLPRKPRGRKHEPPLGRMQQFLTDFSYAFRVLSKRPGMTLLAILALATSLGMSTTTFSALNGMFFKPLPFEKPEELYNLLIFDEGAESKAVPIPVEALASIRELEGIEGLSGYYQGTINISGDGPPERFSGAFVSPNFLEVLGHEPLLGSTFSPSLKDDGEPHQMLISERLWKDRYKGDPAIIGHTVRANGTPHTIVGILPPDFHFPTDSDIWVPLSRSVFPGGAADAIYILSVARIPESTDKVRLQAELDQLYQSWDDALYDNRASTFLTFKPFGRLELNQARVSYLAASIGAVIFILLVSCANVANLIIGRALTRGREMAIRSALGATRWRIARQLLTESLVLASLGAVGGILYALWSIDFAYNLELFSMNLPYWMDIRIDGTVIAFVIAMALLTALVSGLAPAWQASKTDLNEMLKDTSHTSTSFRLGRFTRILATIQIAFSCALLFAAGLVASNTLRMNNIELGYEAADKLTMRMGLFPHDYPTEEDRDAFYRELTERVSRLPGVRSAAVSSWIGQFGNPQEPLILIENGTPVGNVAYAYSESVSPGYFQTMGVELVAGRTFDNRDTRESAGVIVVNRAFSRMFFGDDDPLGRQVDLPSTKMPEQAPGSAPWTIVGIVEDLRVSNFIKPDESEPIFYTFNEQKGSAFMTLIADSEDARSEELQQAIQEVILTLDSHLPVYFTTTMQGVIEDHIYPYTLMSDFFLTVGLMALFLAAIGVYGMLAFNVSRRRREIGIRMALGADSRRIVGQVLRQGFVQVTFGILFGTLLAYIAGQLTRNFLLGTEPFNLPIYMGVLLILCGVAALAFFIPARRASRLSPMEALRYE